MFFLFFSYFGPGARNPRSSRRAGSQNKNVFFTCVSLKMSVFPNNFGVVKPIQTCKEEKS